MGVLDETSHQHRSPEWHITGRDAADQYGNDNPGPGTYAAAVDSNTCAGPQFSIGGASPRFDLHGNDVPGPGTYPASGSCGAQGAGYSIGGQAPRFTADGNFVPGPGTYSACVDSNTCGGPSFSIGGQAPRFTVDGNDVPGPGYYTREPIPSDTPAYSFGDGNSTADRSNITQGDGPGPQAYNPALPKGGPSYSLGGSRIEPKSAHPDVPGPGAYDLKTAFGVQVSVSVSVRLAAWATLACMLLHAAHLSHASCMHACTAHARTRPLQHPLPTPAPSAGSKQQSLHALVLHGRYPPHRQAERRQRRKVL